MPCLPHQLSMRMEGMTQHQVDGSVSRLCKGLAACRLWDLASRTHGVLQQCQTSQRAMPADITSAMRRAQIPYYGGCELNHYPAREDQGKPEADYLTLTSDREPSRAYRCMLRSSLESQASCRRQQPVCQSAPQVLLDCRQDDLWILSSSFWFCEPPGNGHARDRPNPTWTAFARSRWHGPNKDGRYPIHESASMTCFRILALYPLREGPSGADGCGGVQDSDQVHGAAATESLPKPNSVCPPWTKCGN